MITKQERKEDVMFTIGRLIALARNKRTIDLLEKLSDDVFKMKMALERKPEPSERVSSKHLDKKILDRLKRLETIWEK